MQKKLIHLAVAGMYQPAFFDHVMVETPDLVCAVWQPLETVIDRIETTGCIDVQGKTIIFDEAGDRYDLVQAIRDLMDFYDLANSRHNLRVDVAVFKQFANKLDNGSPLFESDLAKLREAICDSKRQSMNLRVSEVRAMLDTIALMREFQRNGFNN